MIDSQKIYLTEHLLDLFNLQDKKIYLDFEKAKNTIDIYHSMTPFANNVVNKELDCTELQTFYINVHWKRDILFPTVCIDIIYKGFYIPLNCFYIKIHIQ